jgi:hypothetical protein
MSVLTSHCYFSLVTVGAGNSPTTTDLSHCAHTKVIYQQHEYQFIND